MVVNIDFQMVQYQIRTHKDTPRTSHKEIQDLTRRSVTSQGGRSRTSQEDLCELTKRSRTQQFYHTWIMNCLVYYSILEHAVVHLVIFHLEAEPTHPHGSGRGSQLSGRGTDGLVALRWLQDLHK